MSRKEFSHDQVPFGLISELVVHVMGAAGGLCGLQSGQTIENYLTFPGVWVLLPGEWCRV